MKTDINSQNRLSATEITQADTLKLGLDVHADKIVVVRILDNGAPQPPQRFTRDQFLAWVEKQRKRQPGHLLTKDRRVEAEA